MKENKEKIKDQSFHSDYIKLYEKNANFSKQYLKNINCVLKLDMIKTKENLYACITNEEYGIYKLLFALSKIDTISTRKSYLCAIKHLIVNIIPDSTNNCSIISHEIKDLIYRNNRITRNKKNSQIKSSSIEHHRFIVNSLKSEFYILRGTLEENVYNKRSELAAIFWILAFLGPIRPRKRHPPTPQNPGEQNITEPREN